MPTEIEHNTRNRLPRRTDTIAHEKLHGLIARHGSLKAAALAAGVPYGRAIRALNGIEPRTSDALAWLTVGIDVADWTAKRA